MLNVRLIYGFSPNWKKFPKRIPCRNIFFLTNGTDLIVSSGTTEHLQNVFSSSSLHFQKLIWKLINLHFFLFFKKNVQTESKQSGYYIIETQEFLRDLYSPPFYLSHLNAFFLPITLKNSSKTSKLNEKEIFINPIWLIRL